MYVHERSSIERLHHLTLVMSHYFRLAKERMLRMEDERSEYFICFSVYAIKIYAPETSLIGIIDH